MADSTGTKRRTKKTSGSSTNVDAPAPQLGALRRIGSRGMHYVIGEAARLGFRSGHPDWANLGQGQPEAGPIEGAPARASSLDLEPEDHAYGPLAGLIELRQLVADHLNRIHRTDRDSQYGPENVAITQGGRPALARVLASLGDVLVGHQVPDYTAMEDLLGQHVTRLGVVPLRNVPEEGFRLDPQRFERTVREMGLGAFLLSNPCNPTGHVVEGDRLARLVAVGRELDVTLVIDELYASYVYTHDGEPAERPVSAAAHVEDVERDPVLLIDGLTAGFRYPGWRLGWVAGPSAMIQDLLETASWLDGGCSLPIQRAALAVLRPESARSELDATRALFAKKRQLTLKRLTDMGVQVPHPPRGTFYVWGDLSELASPFDEAESFYRRALQRRVLCVPGSSFDVDPARRRRGPAAYSRWMRFSFGAPLDELRMGLDRLARMVRGEE